MTDAAETRPEKPRRRWLAFAPLGVFVALVGLLLIGLQGNPQRLPSALIGQKAPAFALPALEGIGRPPFSVADLQGQVTLVNVFASWCIPCHDEHPFLMQLAQDQRIRLAGINYKDHPDNARRFLGRNGNPYHFVGVDLGGRAAIDWGVYGVPETFLVGRDGTILFKHVGPITEQNLASVIRPRIEEAVARR